MNDTDSRDSDEYEMSHQPRNKKRKIVHYSDKEESETEPSGDDGDHSEEEEEAETEPSDGDSDHSGEDDSESESEEDEAETSSDLEDNTAFQEWLSEARETTNDTWTEKYEKYIHAGMSNEGARAKATEKTMWAVKRCFFSLYRNFLASHFHLKDDDTHEEVMADIEEKIDKAVDTDKAISRVIFKHQQKFDALFHQPEDEDEDSEGESSS